MSTLKWGRVVELGLTWQRRLISLRLYVAFTQGRDGSCNPKYELRGNKADCCCCCCCCNPAPAPPCIVMAGVTAIAIASNDPPLHHALLHTLYTKGSKLRCNLHHSYEKAHKRKMATPHMHSIPRSPCTESMHPHDTDWLPTRNGAHMWRELAAKRT